MFLYVCASWRERLGCELCEHTDGLVRCFRRASTEGGREKCPLHMPLVPLCACTASLSRLRPSSCHDLSCCSKASPRHRSPVPSPVLLLLLLSLISPRIKVTSLSPHPSTRTPPRSGLSAAHSRQCQAEIILSVKRRNEARHTHALKNKHPPELRDSTFVFEER